MRKNPHVEVHAKQNTGKRRRKEEEEEVLTEGIATPVLTDGINPPPSDETPLPIELPFVRELKRFRESAEVDAEWLDRGQTDWLDEHEWGLDAELLCSECWDTALHFTDARWDIHGHELESDFVPQCSCLHAMELCCKHQSCCYPEITGGGDAHAGACTKAGAAVVELA